MVAIFERIIGSPQNTLSRTPSLNYLSIIIFGMLASKFVVTEYRSRSSVYCPMKKPLLSYLEPLG
jgi:hypothetical protein